MPTDVLRRNKSLLKSQFRLLQVFWMVRSINYYVMEIQMVNYAFKASGGWTEPWDGNSINTDAWGAPYSFTLLNLTTGQGYSSGSVTNHFDSR